MIKLDKFFSTKKKKPNKTKKKKNTHTQKTTVE